MLFVTGASGLLGANLVSSAHDQGREVTGLYNRHAVALGGVNMVQLDLSDQAATRKLLVKLKPKSVIHCAAATNVDWCEEHRNEAEQINAHASSVLARIARDIDASFVYISTDAVFDGKRGNYSETDAPAPINAYGKSKLKGEQEVLRWHPSALVVRVNIYGWNAQEKYSLGEWILHELGDHRLVRGFIDVHFTPILANDLAEILLAMVDTGRTGVYHVGGSERISKFEFAKRLALLFGFDSSRIVPAMSTEIGLRAVRPADISMNTGKIASAMGRAMPDINSSLSRFRKLYEVGYPQMLRGYYLNRAMQ